MTKAIAVIGANYGDEGKGLMTDFLCRKHNSNAVVRFNGGAQAGHTVCTEDGKRHVFHHLGSGTFAGAATILSKHFILNPILFRSEYEEFVKTKGITPVVYYDPRCRVTTPWDMAYNQEQESGRVVRHGSCGVGINATVDREEWVPTTLDTVAHYTYIIMQYYKEKKGMVGEFVSDARWCELTEKFRQDIEFMLSVAKPFTDIGLASYIVFEGAQGLALDEYSGDYPNVTRSRTGLPNVVDFCREFSVSLDEVVYVTRSYLTRHGNGEFNGGNDISLEDNTNKPNDWQGTIRMKKFNFDSFIGMLQRCSLDWNAYNATTEEYSLAVTHCDQIENEDLCNRGNVKYMAYSPTAAGVKQLY